MFDARKYGGRRAAVAATAGVAAAIALAAAALGVLALTPFGAAQVLRIAASRIPGQLAVGRLDGNLASGLELGGVRYRDENVDADIGALAVTVSWRDLIGRRIVLRRLHIADGRLELAAAPATDTGAFAGASDASAADVRLPDVLGGLDVHDLRVDGFDVVGLGAPLRVEMLRGSLERGVIALERLVASGGSVTLDASGSAELGAGRASGRLDAVVQASGTDDDVARRFGAIEVATAFVLDEDAGDGRSQASLDWSLVDWRRRDGARLVSRSGRLDIRPGTSGRLDVALAAEIEGEPLPAPASISATASVSADVVDVARARIALGGAEAVAAGAFDVGARSGYVALEYGGVDPAVLDADMSGELGGRIDIAVAATPGLTIAGSGRIDGELAGRPLDGRLVASYAADTLSIDTGDVALGGGRIVVGGTLAVDSANLRFSARLPRIEDWYPQVTGALTAAGSIVGDTDDPRVELELDGQRLAWQDGPAPPLERVSLRVHGTRAAHRVDIDAEGTLGRARLEAEQHYADGGVHGRLLESVLEPHDAGVWRLGEPATYAAAPERIELGTACLIGPDRARICGAVERDRLALAVRAVPHALAAPWLPKGFVVAGTASADADIVLAEPLAGTVTLRHDGLRIGFRHGSGDTAIRTDETRRGARDGTATVEDGGGTLEDGDVVPLLELGDVVLSASLDADALAVTLSGGAPQAAAQRHAAVPGEPSAGEAASAAPASLVAPSAVAGQLTVSPPAADGRLEGSVSARLTELGLLGALIDGIEGLSGRVDASLEISGTPESPNVSGFVSGAELAADLPMLGIAVTDGRASAALDEIASIDTVPFAAELCSMSCARIAGRLSLDDREAWSLIAQVDGDDVLLVDLPELRAVVSPRLDVRASPALATIVGTLSVPEGAIEIDDVPRTAIRPARETVVHGRDAPEDDARRLPIPLAINVDASLGDVRFEGLGLEAELAGTLDVEHSPAGEWFVNGTATIETGTFGAYGQMLTIEQGLLVFTGAPDNPTLDIRATRIVDGSELGLAITGTAENPRSEVFSAAGLSESDAFAQLLTGRSLVELDEGDPDALERAAIGLGLRRALPTLGRIGSALGLDELGVDAPDAVEGAVVAGRQIGSDVYLRYRHGLFDDFSGLELIYRITERFRLRTQTGTAQSIDVIYEVDPGGPDTLAQDVEDIDVAIQGPRDDPTALGPGVDAN